jgi:hypothetical protein
MKKVSNFSFSIESPRMHDLEAMDRFIFTRLEVPFEAGKDSHIAFLCSQVS